MSLESDHVSVGLVAEAAQAALEAARAELGEEELVPVQQLRDALEAEIVRIGPSAIRELRENLSAGLGPAAVTGFLEWMRLAGVRAARALRARK